MQPETTTTAVESPLFDLIRAVEMHAGVRLPMVPETLAACLGLRLAPTPGTQFRLRADRIYYDPTLSPERRASVIARGCAYYVLRESRLLKTFAVGDVAQLLCGQRVRF